MREVLLKTRKFDIERRTLVRPGGREVTRELVVHPGAVVLLPILDDGRIVMIRNVRHAAGQELLELPAGTREPNESAEATAFRELEEETGYRAERIAPMLEFYPSPGILTELMHVFVATGLRPSVQRLQGDEEIVVELHDPHELRRLVVDGHLRDGKTIAVLATYLLRANSTARPESREAAR